MDDVYVDSDLSFHLTKPKWLFIVPNKLLDKKRLNLVYFINKSGRFRLILISARNIGIVVPSSISFRLESISGLIIVRNKKLFF